MRIFDYVPEIYKYNIDYLNIISSEEKELEGKLKHYIKQEFENNFIKLADIEGIRKFEVLFNIKPNEDLEDLEFRRQRLFNRLTSRPPFTEKFLQRRLTEILGEDNWEYNMNYNTYTLDIYTLRPGRLWLQEFIDFMTVTIPCNILWTLYIYSIIWQAVLDNANDWQYLVDANLTWEDVMYGEWIENWEDYNYNE